MNAILSLIVSLAMLLSGVGELPAVPETASQYTLRNLTLTVNDETVTLDPELQLTTALGTEEANVGFELHAGDGTLLPISGRLDTNGATFSLADNGQAYTVSYDTLGALLGLTEETDEKLAEVLGTAAEMFVSMSAYETAAKDPEVQQKIEELSWQQINGWLEVSDAEFKDIDVDVNGSVFPGQYAELNLSFADVYAGLDSYLTCDIEPLRNYMQTFLALLNVGFGTDCTGFVELIEIAAASEGDLDLNMKLPVTMTIAEQDGVEYVRETIEMSADGVDVNFEMTAISDGTNVDLVMIMNGSEDETDVELSLNLFADAQNLSAVFDIAGEDRSAGGSLEEIKQIAATVSEYVFIDENGLAESFSDFILESAKNYEYDDSTEISAVYVSAESSEFFEEDGSITADNIISLSLDLDTALTAELAFQTNRATVPYADAFAGREMLELTEDTESEAYQQIQTDLIALLGDVMTLAADDSVVQMMNTFGAVKESFEDDDYDDYDYDFDDYDYSFTMDDNNPATLEEAEEIYGSPIPAFTAPEGYTLDYIYADEGYLSVDYAAEDTYFSMVVTPTYDDITTGYYMLGEDGALNETAGTLVQLIMNEDGSVAYADVTLGDSDITIFFDDVDMATAEMIMAGLMK